MRKLRLKSKPVEDGFDHELLRWIEEHVERRLESLRDEQSQRLLKTIEAMVGILESSYLGQIINIGRHDPSDHRTPSEWLDDWGDGELRPFELSVDIATVIEEHKKAWEALDILAEDLAPVDLKRYNTLKKEYNKNISERLEPLVEWTVNQLEEDQSPTYQLDADIQEILGRPTRRR